MNGRVKSDGSSLGEDDDIATVEETFEDDAETSSGLANTSPHSMRGSSPLANPLNVSVVNREKEFLKSFQILMLFLELDNV